MNKQSLHHIGMNVSNLDISVDFYQRAIGFTLIRRWKGEPDVAMMDMGDGGMLELFQRPEELKGTKGPLIHIALAVDDVDAAYNHARGEGADDRVSPIDVHVNSHEPYPLRVAFVKGPDDEHIEFVKEEWKA